MSVHGRLLFEPRETKLALPIGRAGSVHRSELVERLASASESVIVLEAPAGYGKTTALGQWAESDPRPFAWVTLDPRDDDAITLLVHLAIALDRIEPVDATLIAALQTESASIWPLATRLGAELACRSEPLVIVLDDVHRIGSRDSLDTIAALLADAPLGATLALSGRAMPALGLPRLRAQGRLLEIGVEDLRLDEVDAVHVLRQAGVELPADELAKLMQATEGWPVGVYLAAQALRAGTPAAVSKLTGSDRFISDYFREELLADVSPAELDFLTRSSVLGQMCGPLCDACLERTGSAEVLESLERSNLFVVPLDHRREWYRYHHLFHDVLLDQLARSNPEQVRALNRRASAWSIENGDPEAAIDYAQAARDMNVLADLVVRHTMPYYYGGRLATVERWLGWFDTDDLYRYPSIAVLGGWIRLLTGRPEEAVRWAREAELGAADCTMALPDGSRSVTSWIAPLRACLCADGPERMRDDARTALAGLAPDSPWRAMAGVMLGVGHLLAGDEESADRELSEAIDLAIPAGARHTAVHGLGQRAALALDRGDTRLASELLARVDDVSGPDIGAHTANAIVLTARARVSELAGDPEDVRTTLARAQRLRPLLTWALGWYAVQVRLELARVYLRLGDVEPCRMLLVEMEDILRRRPHLGILVDAVAELKRQLASRVGVPGNWASTLTEAELRLLPLLATHLTLQQIAGRLFVSRNTVKSTAASTYRKLGASSRSEAVAHAVELGLLDSPLALARDSSTT